MSSKMSSSTTGKLTEYLFRRKGDFMIQNPTIQSGGGGKATLNETPVVDITRKMSSADGWLKVTTIDTDPNKAYILAVQNVFDPSIDFDRYACSIFVDIARKIHLELTDVYSGINVIFDTGEVEVFLEDPTVREVNLKVYEITML